MHNVIVYVHDLRSSGVVRNAIDYARRLARRYPTTLVVGDDRGLFREEAIGGGFDVHVLGVHPGPLVRAAAALRLRSWLRTQPPSLILSVGNLGHPSCYWATRGLDHVVRVYRISNAVAGRGGVLRAARRLRWMEMLVRDAARIVLVGSAHRDVPVFAGALADGRAIELANAVDVSHAQRRAAEPAPHPWLKEEIPVVVTIGRLRPQKNLDVLIAGVALARRERRMRLAIIGGGAPAERDRLEALAREAGLGGDFLLAGETDNVFAWLGRASAFALASRWEGSSMALLEALAVGTPVVASRLAGDAARVLEDGRHGLLFDGEDPAALAAALLVQTSPAAVLPTDWQPDTRGGDAYLDLIDATLRGAGSRAEAAVSA